MPFIWLYFLLIQGWWRGNVAARLICTFVLTCVLCDLVLGDCQITPATPIIIRVADLVLLVTCAAVAWWISGVPVYFRMWRAWVNRPPWYADFYGSYTTRSR